jgi:hypothetical protein
MIPDLDLDAIIRLAWSQLWQVTLVALVLGGAARWLGRSRPRLAYTLGMLIVIKALVPPVMSSPTGVLVHPAEACAGLEKSEHAGSTWSCVQ